MYDRKSQSPIGKESDLSNSQPTPREKVDERHETSRPQKTVQDIERSFEVPWNANNDPTSPRLKSRRRKWLITAVLSSSALCITMNSSIYVATYDQLIPLFDTTRLVATVGLSSFVMGLGIGPMFLAPLSEFYGRRPIYIGSLTMVFIWIIPCAVAKNMETIIVTRFFDGLFGSVFLSVASGSVGDLFDPAQLSLPMAVYTASPMIGPALGPLVGGFINQYTNWRWSFWVLLIWTGVQLALVSVFVPETYHPVLTRRKARKMRQDSGDDRWQAPIEKMEKSITKTVLWSCIRPFQLLVLDPMVSILCIYSALLLGILYLFFGAYPLIFGNNHGFDLSQTGLTFLGIFFGEACAISLDPIWRTLRRRMQRKKDDASGKPGEPDPEFRLPPTVFGAPLVTIGLFGFAFSTYSSVRAAKPG